ncbi:antitoxin [Streptococcus chosunense]|uniref:Antitoxin n=1 Tax=Streptococcus chosunensis TaxID=2707003 RepID=A0A3B0BBP3_9STRE|nr:antitoxin [Streptococcus chosunense]RKN70705.1 antitoxin [Streptococcus chosunense]
MNTVALRNVSFKTEPDIVDEATKVFRKKGYSLSKGLSLFLKTVAVEEDVNLPSADELEKEMLFKKLQAEINQSVADMEKGIYFTKEDLVKRYEL